MATKLRFINNQRGMDCPHLQQLQSVLQLQQQLWCNFFFVVVNGAGVVNWAWFQWPWGDEARVLIISTYAKWILDLTYRSLIKSYFLSFSLDFVYVRSKPLQIKSGKNATTTLYSWGEKTKTNKSIGGFFGFIRKKMEIRLKMGLKRNWREKEETFGAFLDELKWKIEVIWFFLGGHTGQFTY